MSGSREEKYNELVKDLKTEKYGKWLFDPTTNNLEWDDDMYALFEVNKDDFQGAYEAWMDTLHPEDVEAAPKDFEKALLGTGHFEAKFRIQTKDGRIKNVGAKGIIDRDDNGSPVFVTGINWDIDSES
jgi:PAS domain-containing protein